MTRLIRRQRRLLALTLSLGVLLCAYRTLTQPRLYTATAYLRFSDDSLLRQLRMTPQASAEEVKPRALAEGGVRYFNDLMQNTLPGGFVDEAVRRAGLPPLPPAEAAPRTRASRGGWQPDPYIDKLRRSIWSSVSSPDVLVIGIVWDDKDECEALLQAFQEQFKEQNTLAARSQTVGPLTFLDHEIHRAGQQLQGLVDGRQDGTGAAESEGRRMARQAKVEAVRQHLKELHLRRLAWDLQANARRVTGSSMITAMNLIHAEPALTPLRLLAEIPGCLLRCTLIAFVLVLPGAALRRALLRRKGTAGGV